MTKVQQTTDELLNHLKQQIRFLINSAKSYDNGFEDEAKRLAVSIRILVYDTPKCKCLLTQLDKKRIGFFDTASPYFPNNIAANNCLTIMRFSPKDGATFIARLDNSPPSRANKRIPFDEWWSNIIIGKDINQNTFTRSDLVLNVANTDGGAHVDPKLNEAYASFSRFNTLGWKVFRNGLSDDFKNNPTLPSIRQIAHEVIKTLKDEFPDIFQDL